MSGSEVYPFLECRDLRHSWRGEVTHTVYPAEVLARFGRGGKWPKRKAQAGRSAWYLIREVTCSSCGTVRVETYALGRQSDGTFTIGARVSSSYRYAEHYLLEKGERVSREDYRMAALLNAFEAGRVHIFAERKE